jgi:hypothetical protein
MAHCYIENSKWRFSAGVYAGPQRRRNILVRYGHFEVMAINSSQSSGKREKRFSGAPYAYGQSMKTVAAFKINRNNHFDDWFEDLWNESALLGIYVTCHVLYLHRYIPTFGLLLALRMGGFTVGMSFSCICSDTGRHNPFQWIWSIYFLVFYGPDLSCMDTWRLGIPRWIGHHETNEASFPPPSKITYRIHRRIRVDCEIHFRGKGRSGISTAGEY